VSELGKKAGAAGSKAAADIAEQLRRESNFDPDYVLVYMAMLLAGLLGTTSAALGEQSAFALWDVVRKTGTQGMQMINATEPQVKH
jgi:hypothetical protein